MSVICNARCVKRLFICSRKRYLLCLAVFAVVFLILIYEEANHMLLHTAEDDAVEHVKFTNTYVYDETPSSVGDRFKRRRQHLDLYCKNKSRDSLSKEYGVKSHLIVDDKHQLVYCYIEKIGCTFWKRVFQILNGFKNVTDPFRTRGIEAYGGYQTAEKLPFYRITYIFGHSKKFLFVREPYERLLSGYVDKLFLTIVPYWLDLGRYIIEKFRTRTNATAKKCGETVTFEEFVQYFIYSQQNNVKRDAHFDSSYDHCRPCDLDYDYIGKLETFKEDTIFLLEDLKLNQTVEIKTFEEKSERDAIILAIDWSHTVQETVDSCIPRSERLFRTYRTLQIRGMISKDIPFPFSYAEGMNVGINECKQIFLDIHARSGPPEVRRLNKRDAFMEAYSSLSRDLLMQLREHLSIDAEPFGYETYPEILKTAESYIPEFRYFDTSDRPRQKN